MDIPASFRRGLNSAQQVQPAGRVVGDKMLDIPDELSPVTRFDKRPVVTFREWQGLPAVTYVLLRLRWRCGELLAIPPPGDSR